METTADGQVSPRELPLVGGHLALDFANTVDDPLGPARHDHLSSYAGLLHWAVRSGVIDSATAEQLGVLAAGRPRQAAAVLRKAETLRASLNDAFVAVIEGRDVSTPWEDLRPHLVRATDAAQLEVGGAGVPELTWKDTKLDHVLHAVASAAAGLLTSPDVLLVKQCARCPWLFLDRSKNHSRRWCDMNDCGRAEKIERILARRAAARDASPRRTRNR